MLDLELSLNFSFSFPDCSQEGSLQRIQLGGRDAPWRTRTGPEAG